jgi:predicted transcriptional regulator
MITGELLKKMREEIGMTQERLAESVGISQAHVAKIENEKVNPRLSTVNKIMSVLKSNSMLKCDQFQTKKVIYVNSKDSVNHAAKLMKGNDISQLPVIDKGICVGSLSDKTIVRNLDRISKTTKIMELMEEPFPTINCGEEIEVVKTLLEYHPAILIMDRGKIVGILTKSDLLDLLK